MIYPVFADGPLRGRADIVISNLSDTVCAEVREMVAAFPSPWEEISARVCYRFMQYAIFGRVIYIGICGDPESAEVQDSMWEILITGAGKAAAQGGYRFVPKANWSLPRVIL
jgi:hypothetical protein